ncbi:BnaC07g01090D [Brassica napus]|uniref:BnaC07g01090D protein n=1 Tax=Brassica napus TaxID=3708 RepID=A0A078HGJ7_BRANA|nr:BnaC07g01090D [Brassica napus]
MEVVSSSTYLQAGLEKGDNCVMVCLCWKVTMILSVSFYRLIPQLATSRGSATIIVAMLEELLRRGQIIFSTTPQEHYFDCPIHLMLPLHGGGGGSNMTKKIFVGN